MKIRAAMLLVALVLGAGLEAQTSLNFSTPDLTYIASFGPVAHHRFDLDHGAAAGSITVTVDATTTLEAGLSVAIIDCDEYVNYGAAASATSILTSAGSVKATFTTPVRSGIHAIVVRLSAYPNPVEMDYAATVSVSSGSINVVNTGVEVTRDPYNWSTTLDTVALWRVGGKFGFYQPELASSDIRLEFGTTPHDAALRVMLNAPRGFVAVRLLDVTASPKVEIASFLGGVDGEFNLDEPVTISARSGTMWLQIVVECSEPEELQWELYFGSDTLVVDANLSNRPTLPHSNACGCHDGPSCAANGTRGTAVPALIAAIAYLALRRRRELNRQRGRA